MLWFSLLVLSSVATSSSTAQVGAITSTTSLNEQSNIRFLQALAQGSKSLQHKQAQTAKIALEKAVQNNPRSPKAHHLLAIALAQLGQNELALTSLNTSVELGNRSLEADELRALLLIQLGKPEQARQLISSVDSLNMALIGVSLDDPESITSVSSYLNEPSYRGLLSSSVLAASAAKKGLRVQATSLAAVAQELGHQFSKAPWSNALRDLLGRMNKQGGSITSQGRLRTSFEQVKNPEFQAAGQAKVRSALRISTIAEAALALTFDSFRVDTAILSLHRAYLTERELLQDYTLNGLAWSSRVTIPLNKRPNATRLHLNLRVRDLHADNYKVHFANNLEGGPSLKLPLGPRTFIELGILGSATDFIDRSPPDDVVSSQNRDAVGQRAFVEVSWWNPGFQGEVSGSFLRDDARGEAFDMNSLSLSARVLADLSGGLFLRTGAGVGVGRFGPVGEASVLGAAAIRNEFRVYGEIAVLVQLTSWLQFSLENYYLQNGGRTGHAYTDNLLSIGLEARY